MVYVSEFKKGYKKSNGEIVDDKYEKWKILFKQGLVNYINNHFNIGMVVEIKGEVLPYAVNHGTIMDGYSVLGQTINMFSFPRANALHELGMIKESQLHGEGTPDLDEYNKPDF